MGGLISGKGTYTQKKTKDFSCHVNVEHLAENGNESKYSTKYAGSLGRHDTAEADTKQTERMCI